MDGTGLLLFLGLMGSACSSPIPTCPKNCRITTACHHVHFKHVSDLNNNSVAPWTMTNSEPVDGRKPRVIPQAVCGKCTQENMESKPIYVQISVIYESQNPNVGGCCRCNMDVAVGCTCVKTQQH